MTNRPSSVNDMNNGDAFRIIPTVTGFKATDGSRNTTESFPSPTLAACDYRAQYVGDVDEDDREHTLKFTR